MIPVLAWFATAAETVLGIALVLGFLPRWAGLLSGIVLLLFALGMCVGTGVKSALAYSVFSASAAGFALFAVVPIPQVLERAPNLASPPCEPGTR